MSGPMSGTMPDGSEFVVMSDGSVIVIDPPEKEDRAIHRLDNPSGKVIRFPVGKKEKP